MSLHIALSLSLAFHKPSPTSWNEVLIWTYFDICRACIMLLILTFLLVFLMRSRRTGTHEASGRYFRPRWRFHCSSWDGFAGDSWLSGRLVISNYTCRCRAEMIAACRGRLAAQVAVDFVRRASPVALCSSVFTVYLQWSTLPSLLTSTHVNFRLLIKLFRTSNRDIINECCSHFCFKLPSEILPARFDRFLCKLQQQLRL